MLRAEIGAACLVVLTIASCQRPSAVRTPSQKSSTKGLDQKTKAISNEIGPQLIQGEWEVVHDIWNGRETHGMVGSTYKFGDGKVEIEVGDYQSRGEFKTRQTRGVWEIDGVLFDENMSGGSSTQEFTGIFRFPAEDKLEICASYFGGERPTCFESPPPPLASDSAIAPRLIHLTRVADRGEDGR